MSMPRTRPSSLIPPKFENRTMPRTNRNLRKKKTITKNEDLEARQPMLTRIYSEIAMDAREDCVRGGRLEYKGGGIGSERGWPSQATPAELTPFVAQKFGRSAHWFVGRKRLSGCCLGLRGGGCRGRFGRGAWKYYDR